MQPTQLPESLGLVGVMDVVAGTRKAQAVYRAENIYQQAMQRIAELTEERDDARKSVRSCSLCTVFDALGYEQCYNEALELQVKELEAELKAVKG